MGLVHLFSNSGSDLVKLLESIWEISLIKPHFSGDGLEKMLQDKYFAVFFPSDKTSTVVSLKKHKHLIRVHSAQKISVKYGREWFDGNIVGSGATKSDCDLCECKATSFFYRPHSRGIMVAFGSVCMFSRVLVCVSSPV